MIYPSSRSMIHVCKLITAAYASVSLNRSLYSIVVLFIYKINEINVILSQHMSDKPAKRLQKCKQ